jgi:recombination protein RecA
VDITSILRLGADALTGIEVISTRSKLINDALGIGGFPKGRITEISGVESAGKTTLCLHAIAEVQSKGGKAVFIDMEHALDPVYAAALGVNIDDLLISQPDYAEMALDIAEDVIRSGDADIVVVDSVAALAPKAEIEGSMEDQQMGLQARIMGKAMRKLAGVTSQTNTCLVFTNQIREKVGVMFGANTTTPGGRALKFFTSVRLDIRRIGSIKKGDEDIGNTTKVRVVKNKLAPPFKTVEVEIIFGKGIDSNRELVNIGLKNKKIEQAGAWFTLADHKIQGKENLIDLVGDDPEVRKLLL